jgi:hypothetical protein
MFGGVSWKLAEGKCGEIALRRKKHGKAKALRVLLTLYRCDCRPSFDQRIFNPHTGALSS